MNKTPIISPVALYSISPLFNPNRPLLIPV